ncbi:D-methionine transport system ATP-binding protein [Bradyrhizobium elkanii]|jgi:D-methionine transport system ATP-binding protein|uniref:methionine ABC transporter ATP-binding protein n=1 Tax=Bradyrhizobium elkanii TaxID=29448 RepID=UPI00209DA803|nr:methionine ABC transporter ATP-binding protein [Bradyrhizobium elkanii]MCP1967056.1 D-methionine transport system ATP-binding protein [Bradyrhizobium elkanii]MCS3523225.1 D-methionine transport system ATP-binding protein [Bradyrhizobium elkanii]MCS4070880.1 D-methionine transport system ATP-binding protein [Bradyrhizobium elkanii]MCS4077511.1 D-methionine transport system ATP-binding protein [Bradyrhizobium elkanii]MCS4111439.1 D-methionine transport system ATP-binding protein [Bradyrhizobi
MNVHQSLTTAQPVAPLPPIPLASSAGDAMIRFEAVSKVYPAYRDKPSVHALQAIDFVIPRGSITGVIGRSGAGKSSLVRLINGLEKPSSGRVVVDNSEISALAGRELRLAQRSIGMIFQHFNLLSSRTAADNIALPLEIAGWSRADIAVRVAELLELVGIADKYDRYPSELSGGQKQRIGIARALATRPNVLLSDEATSALDPQTTRAILDLLANINRELGVTIVLITHEMSVVRQLAKEVAVIDGGHVVERGHVAEIFTHPRHPVTQAFLSEVIGDSVPVSLASRLSLQPVAGGQAVLRVQVRGTEAGDTVVARLSRELSRDVALLSARIDEIGGQHVGSLILGIPGGEAAASQSLAYLSQHDILVERLGYVA